jgi:hypothetical protein
MDNFTDGDITLFINKYTEDVSQNPLRSQKIPLYVQYLTAKKHFRENNIDEDVYFKKRLNITKEDILEIHKLIDKVKRGKNLTKSSSRYGVSGNYNTGYSQEYSGFNENDEYENTGFELLNEVQGAMDSYYKKMKKVKNSRNLRSNNENYQLNRAEQLNRVGSVQGVPDSRYYGEGENSESPNIDFSVQGFAKSELGNMGATNIIQKLDKLNSILDDNQLITNDFDTDYKRSHPALACNKKNTFHNEINEVLPVKDINQTRFWQDQAIMDGRGQTTGTNGSLKNKNPFEHHFDYLGENYNHVPDPRLMGTSSRMDNRSMMKK